MMDDSQDELIAIVAAAWSIQAAAEKAVADLTQLIANNRAVPAQIAKEGGKAKQSIQEAGEEVFTRISKGAEKAIRDAAVSDVGAKVETAMAGPLKTIDEALSKLRQSASTAELAADRWRLFTRVFRWQQLTIAVIAGILMGAVGHWYFFTRGPETEAAEYILFLKHGMERKAAQPMPPSSGSVPKNQKPAASTKAKTKSQSEPTSEATPDARPVPEAAEPPQ